MLSSLTPRQHHVSVYCHTPRAHSSCWVDFSWFITGLLSFGTCVLQAEPTFRAQLWRTVRTLFVAFVVLSGVGALMEERGLTKGILNNPDMRPQMEMKTRFADVKGVDEAKVCIRIVPLTELTEVKSCFCTPAHTGISSATFLLIIALEAVQIRMVSW